MKAFPPDLLHRIRKRMRAATTGLQYRLGLPTLRVGTARLSERFRHPIDATRKSALVARYRLLFPAAVQTELQEARRLLEHKFTLLGHPTSHAALIAWSRDPVSGRNWSRGFSADIPYRGPERLGDIKLPWELNKHQYFFTLGKAAWLSGDPAFAQEIIRQIDHWIEDNPCHRGIHWISALETGTRALSWIMAYPFFAEHGDATFRARLARSTAEHLLFIERNLSIGRFANTHLAGEAAVLAIGGLFLDCAHSERWLRTGLEHLDSEIVQQVRADGAHAEQSVAYHRFFLDQYYLVDAMLEANGRSLTPATGRSLHHMTGFLMDMLFPDGTAPAFGDCDDARGIWCRADGPKDYRSLLALGATRYDRGDFKAIAGGPTEELLWLHGEQGIDRFQALPEQLPEHTSAAYPDAGYYVLRGGWGAADPMLVFDCGPLGHGPAGHGHADALSLQLFAKGYPFLTDSGTYSYNLDYERRNAFRSTPAHNTVVVEHLSQSTARDRMSWATMANSHCRRWHTTPWFDLIDADHDGYHRLPGRVSHRRVVVFMKPDVWVLYDRVEGTGQHELELFLHLRPDCGVALSATQLQTALTSPAGEQLRCSFAKPRPATNAEKGELLCETIVADFSETYGQTVKAPALRISSVQDGRWACVSGFTTSQDAVAKISQVPGGIQITVDRKDRPAETLIYAMDEAQRVEAPDCHFLGTVLYRRASAAANEVIWAAEVRDLAIQGCMELHSASDIASFALHGNSCQLVCSPGQRKDLVLRVPDRVKVSDSAIA